MARAWLIYNPAAGRFPAGWLLSRAVRVLSEAGWEIEVYETEEGQDLSDLAKKAAQAPCETVFVAGGDGSVGRVAAALSGTKTALGVLPAGTANVWAQEIGLQRLDWGNIFALEKAAARLAQGEYRMVDIGSVDTQAFLLWAGIGLDARIVNSIEPRERWEKTFGTVHYALLALWNSIGWEGVELRVRAGDKTWQDRYLVAIASNIRSYAGGLVELTPDAVIDDGLLDFWLIGGNSMRDAVMRIIMVLRGRHVDDPHVVHFRSQEAVFEGSKPINIQCDGEPYDLGPRVEFSTKYRALKVLMPSASNPAGLLSSKEQKEADP